jgi:hypothetical protein
MRLNFLTNSGRNLQDKMRFFSGFFLYANENLGRFPDLPFDNPVSLVNRIIFQLENNIEKCPTYVDKPFVSVT